MKTKLVFSSAALVALSTFALAAPAFADATSTTSWDSDAQVKFEQGDGSTPPGGTGPTLPTDPETPVDPQEGPLALDHASDINYGTHKIDGKTTDFVAKITDNGGDKDGDFKPGVAWHDLRGAGSTAFSITAQTNGFTSLAGSAISFGAGQAFDLMDEDSTTVGDTVTPAGEVTLNNDNQPVTIVDDNGKVPGYFGDVFSNSTLSVPLASQTPGDTQHATITWNLTLAK